MRRWLTVAFLVTLLNFSGFAQKQRVADIEEKKNNRLKWWVGDRFGLFIHWGLYALPARHEWVQQRERLTNDQYRIYFNQFNPDLYDPVEWARLAKQSGIRYAVLTTKHHEGFCLFDSEFTEFKSTNTLARRDLVREYVDAFRSEGIKIGFYYSLIDWNHNDFTVDVLHPQRPERFSADTAYARLNKDRNMEMYREYLFNQVKELLTNYGKVDIIWYDYSYPVKNGKSKKDWNSEELIKLTRKLQPDILINNRLDVNEYEDGFDFITPEQYKVPAWPMVNRKKVPWETCQTFSGSWGYNRDETSWKSTSQLLELLIETVSKGGNLLLNVGPTGRGVIDKRAVEKLNAIGGWLKYNGDAIYDCTQAPDYFQKPENCLLTYNPVTRKLYIHLLIYPLQSLRLPGYAGKIKYAQFLHDHSELKMIKPYHEYAKISDSENDLIISLPVQKPESEIPVIELILK